MGWATSTQQSMGWERSGGEGDRRKETPLKPDHIADKNRIDNRYDFFATFIIAGYGVQDAKR